MTANDLIFSKIKEMSFKKLNSLAKLIAEKNNKSAFYVKFDMLRNFIRYGIGYTDYFKSDFINLTKKEKKTFVTTKNYFNMIGYFNDRRYRRIFQDKIIFNKMFRDFIHRDYIDIRAVGPEGLKEFMEGRETVFAKAFDDFGGHNMSKLIVKDEKDISELYNRLIDKRQFLVEETVIQHPELNRLNPYAVNTFRIVTLYNKGESYILNNALRINVDTTSAVGCSDVFAKLDENGKKLTPFFDDMCKEYKKHPLTGEDLVNINIPYVKEAFEMVKKAAKVVPDIRYVGWDVAITEKGPLILEGNEYPSYGLIQYYPLAEDPKKGHLAYIEEIIGDEFKNIKL